MRKFYTNHRRRILGLVAVLAVGIGTFAVAQWLSEGTGPSSGRVGTPTVLTLDVATDPDAPSGLLPGGTSSAIAEVTNPGETTLYIHSLSDPLDGVWGGFGYPEYNTDLAEHVTINPGAVSPAIAIPTGTTTVEIPDVFAMDESAPQRMAGHPFTKAITVTASNVP